MLLAKILVFAIVYFIIIRPIYAAYGFTRPPRLRVTYRTPVDFAPEYENITLTSADNTRLSAWYIPSTNGAAILLLHGHSGNRLGAMYHAEKLVSAGYGVLMPDLRRHGSSEGKVFGRGEAERDDVLTAVSYLSKRPDINPGGIGIFGISVGGTLALHAAAATVAIRAVAVDGPSLTAMADLPAPQGWLNRLVNWPLQAYYMALLQRFYRKRPLPPNLSILPHLSQPSLFIATGEGMEAQLTRRFYDAAPDPKLLWLIPESSHGQGWHARPDAYGQVLVSFFDHTLMHKADGDWSMPDLSTIAATLETAVPTPTPAPAVSEHGKIAYDATIPPGQANAVAMLLLPLSFILFGGIFWLVWRDEMTRQLSSPPSLLKALLLFVLAILVHELLHIFGFLVVGRAPRTAVKVGFSWKMMAPYAHCSAPLSVNAYRVAIALPGLMLGLLPGIVGIAIGSLWWTLFGVLMLIAAGGDLAVLLAVRRVPRRARVLDHPTEAGCQVLGEEDEPSIANQ
ncbi:MAG: alpha/beta fold hydrolase [Chloroflexota bacterium]